MKKLPTVKILSAEYAEAKKEMRDLLVHKANVEYIPGLEEQERTRIRAQERE